MQQVACVNERRDVELWQVGGFPVAVEVHDKEGAWGRFRKATQWTSRVHGETLPRSVAKNEVSVGAESVLGHTVPQAYGRF
jgi:hypothetical protein